MKQTRQGLIIFGCIKKYTFVRLSIKDAGEAITKNTIEQIKSNTAVVRSIGKKSICRFTFLVLKSNHTHNLAI